MATLLTDKKQLLNKSKSVIHSIKGYLKTHRRCFQVAFLSPDTGWQQSTIRFWLAFR